MVSLMGFIGGKSGYRILRRLSPGGKVSCCGGTPDSSNKLDILGNLFWKVIKDRHIVDFGCGYGDEAIHMARRGAAQVVGIDIRENVLDIARQKAIDAGVENSCRFVSDVAGLHADIIVSIDAFEHFDDPGAILDIMAHMLNRDGRVWISFGPPWYHPAGGHGFSVFPWAHLVFTEASLIRWRSDFKTDGATCFGEVSGGLNQMTVRHFIRLVERSPLRFDYLECVPIRRARWFHNRLTREFFTSIVQCRLARR